MFPRKRHTFWGYSTLLFFSTAVSIRFVYFRVNGLGLLFTQDFPLETFERRKLTKTLGVYFQQNFVRRQQSLEMETALVFEC